MQVLIKKTGKSSNQIQNTKAPLGLSGDDLDMIVYTIESSCAILQMCFVQSPSFACSYLR